MQPRLTQHDDALAVAMIRGIAMDAPLRARSGHQGTAMSLAGLGHVLYTRVMRHTPLDPQWHARDRFILSNGHASILQYALLFLQGYGLELDDLREFRQFGSATPGHPEVGHTVGVEVTTGPLGQGFANAVGMAIAETRLRAEFGAASHEHHTWVVLGDGCLMEGVSHEAASLAGHLRLDHLVAIFDDNRITIDGSTDLAVSDDVPERFRAYGWNVVEAGEIADDLDALEAVLLAAREHRGSPTMIVLRTRIGHPSPDFTDRHEAHGNPFLAEHVTRTKAVLGIPDEPFWTDPDVVSRIRDHARSRCAADREATLAALGDRADDWHRWLTPVPSSRWNAAAPSFDDGAQIATRVAVQKAIEASLGDVPGIVAGAADLTGNTGVKLSGRTAFSTSTPDGVQLFYGVREHAMGAVAVGMALHGGILPVVGTFFVFSDYMRPAIRLAALSKARVVFVFSHDSVGVGEDGPTHQPIEHLASLRAIPGIRVVRPADANETALAWREACDHDGPTALVLSRQNTPVITDGSAVHLGAGIVGEPEKSPDVVLLATGTEVAVAARAASELRADDVRVRVVSMPCWEDFAHADPLQRSEIIPIGVPVVSIEAGSTFGWSRWADVSIGIDTFGASAPGDVAMERLGISVGSVVTAVRELLDAFA